MDERIGLGPINPEPYWGFEDLRYAIGSKIMNCFYVVAESKVENGHEYFKYIELFILSGFSFEKFLNCLEEGAVFVDFDARTGHNHGTSFVSVKGIGLTYIQMLKEKYRNTSDIFPKINQISFLHVLLLNFPSEL